jgi:putative ABC transport system permease protein
VMDLWLPSPHDAAGTIRNAHLLARLIDRLHRLPGVERVGGVNAFPLQGGNTQNGTFLILQRPDEVSDFEDFERLSHQPARTGEAEYRVASGGYFGAMGIPLVRGRLFDERDSFEAPNVAVISASLARSRWPNEDPIGKLIQFGNMDGDLRPFTIVGIVGDVREESIDEASRPTFYASYRQRAVAGFHVAIQERGDIGVLTSSARRVAADMSPTVPVHFESVTQIVSSSLADRRFLLLLLGLFAALALVLATTGVYGIVAYGASQRTSEIGVRMALGARGGDIVRLLVRQGATYAAAGVAVGLGVALALSRFLRSLCYGITTTDPVSFVVTSIALLAAAIAASWIPARRASRIDPMEALRHE